ncbi:MAG: DNA recombination protein RmuC [Eubacteriales bacterium]|nr:DNA recombination protein RmuC [Eubacteriales bacterium]
MYIILLSVVIAIEIILLIFILTKKSNNEVLKNDIARQNESAIETFKAIGDGITKAQTASGDFQRERLEQIQKSVSSSLAQQELRFKTFESETREKLENIRSVTEKQLLEIRNDNSKRLDEMRQTVDEKLQKTLEEKMNESFRLVSERLEQVYKGLGEMQTLATGVGDLKKVLSNVKTRGILGEIQLGSILKEILSPQQYDENVVTVPNSRNPVEFAVKFPHDDGGFTYLPIDSKFPLDAYSALQESYENGDAEAVKSASNTLCSRLKQFAKDVHEKYVLSPYTTEFAIIFLPVEGLYAEVVNRGMVEVLQREYKVNITGPSTMAALLNSLQMGFKTLAIEKRSAEVWTLLGAVKKEFDTFGKVLDSAQKKIEQANSELDKLVGVRTRAIERKLKNVESLDEESARTMLEIEE